MTTMPPELPINRASTSTLPELALVFAQAGTVDKLTPVVANLGRLVAVHGGVAESAKALADSRPRLVFLDFSPAQSGRSATLAKQLAATQPHLALVAVGNSAIADSVLAALRSGVRDFVDLDNADGEASAIIHRALTASHEGNSGMAAPATRGKMVAILGARVGVGASTAAVNLALLCQRLYGAEGRALLLDFGIPVADASLYLNQKREFDLLQAINSLSRIDETFIASAFARHSSGFTLLPMPSQPERMREISYDDALGLLNLMRGFFPTILADLGGCSDLDFVAAMVRQADEVLLVSDPSAGAIVSARSLVQGLADRSVIVNKLQLVLSKHDEALALTAADVAKRLGVQALCELPHRHVPLLQASNQGKALAELAPNDPYIAALGGLVRKFDWLPSSGARPSASKFGGGLVSGLRSLVQR